MRQPVLLVLLVLCGSGWPRETATAEPFTRALASSRGMAHMRRWPAPRSETVACSGRIAVPVPVCVLAARRREQTRDGVRRREKAGDGVNRRETAWRGGTLKSCGVSSGHVRVCYANLSLEKTREAAKRLRAGLEGLVAGGPAAIGVS